MLKNVTRKNFFSYTKKFFEKTYVFQRNPQNDEILLLHIKICGLGRKETEI